MVDAYAVETLARQHQRELRADAARARLYRLARARARAHAHRSPRLPRLRREVGWFMVHHGLRLALHTNVSHRQRREDAITRPESTMEPKSPATAARR